MSSVRRFVALAAFAAAAATAAPSLAGDIVINSQGKPLGNSKANNPPTNDDYGGSEWEIVDETLDGVAYRIPGVPNVQTLPWSSVAKVFHDPTGVPSDLARGEQFAQRGDTEAARELLERVEKDANALPWAKARAAFLAANSHYDDGNAAEAEKALAAFKAQFPKSRWVTTATENRARSLMALEKIEDAKTEFASLRKLPGVSEDIGFEVDYNLVWIDEQVAARRNDQAGLQTALKNYEGLISKLQAKSGLATLLVRCQVGRASCLILLGKAPEARDVLAKLAGDAKDQRARAAIYNKLGVATWRAAPTDKAAMKEALDHFLRVVTVYGDAPGAEEDCAEAMFHAGELFRELKDQGPDYLQRARREWSEVVSRFPGSVWAQRSKEAMAGR